MGKAAASGLGAIGLLMAASGCSGGNGGDSGGDVPFSRLAAGYAAVLCHKDVVCCDDSELGSNLGPNPDRAALEATCRPNFANAMAVYLEPYAPLISAGRIIYRGDHARLCLDEIAAQPCEEWGLNYPLDRYPACRQIYEGTIALGGACTLSDECVDGYCSSSSGTGTCVAYKQIGESCSSGPCPPELLCLPDASGASKVCAPPLPDGATCDLDSKCASGFCMANVCGPPTFCNGF